MAKGEDRSAFWKERAKQTKKIKLKKKRTPDGKGKIGPLTPPAMKKKEYPKGDLKMKSSKVTRNLRNNTRKID